MEENLINQLYKKNSAFIFLFNEFFKLKYYFIFILILICLIMFGYKYYIHNDENEISIEIQLNPNLTQEFSYHEDFYFAASILENVNQINKSSKETLSSILLQDFKSMTNEKFLDSDTMFDYYLTNLKDKENIINSINTFFKDELNQKSELEKKDFVANIMFNMNFEVLKFFNMNKFNRYISATIVHPDSGIGSRFLVYHLKQIDSKFYDDISYKSLNFVEKTKLMLKNKIIGYEFKLALEQGDYLAQLTQNYNNILDDIRIAEKLDITKPVGDPRDQLFPQPVGNYFKGTTILYEEKEIIEEQLKTFEEDVKLVSEHYGFIKIYGLMLEKLESLDESYPENYQDLSLWSSEAIKIRPTIMSDTKLFMVSILLSIVIWFISSIYFVFRRNIN